MEQRLTPALQSSKGSSLPWGGARLINCYAEQSEGDKAQLFALFTIPGTQDFTSQGTLPVRGMHMMALYLYAVIGTTLYKFDSSGNPTSLGTILGTKPVRMADNGAELAIHNGDTTGYVLDKTGTLSIPLGLGAVSDVSFIDGYFVWTLANSDQFIISGLDDGTSYDPLDVATAEGSPDQLVGIMNDHRELLLFGGGNTSTPSTEVWVDTGNADFPFERQGNAFVERGCVDRDSISKLDNTTFFVGDDRVVYRMAGYLPLRVSTHAVENGIKDATWFRAFSYSQQGHKFYVLNTDQGSWVYDVATQAWHERKSYGLGYYRMGCHADGWNSSLLGDNQTGKIYSVHPEINTEDGNPILVTIELPPIGDGVNRQTLYCFETFMETGVGDLVTTDPQIILQYSRDGGRNWSTEMWRSMGKQGEYLSRAVWRVNVEFRQLQLRLQLPDSVRRCVIGYFADVR